MKLLIGTWYFRDMNFFVKIAKNIGIYDNKDFGLETSTDGEKVNLYLCGKANKKNNKFICCFINAIKKKYRHREDILILSAENFKEAVLCL